MLSIQSLENSSEWRLYFAKRYLPIKHFISLCKAVGLYGCTEWELEEYEQKRLMFPVARIVMPEEYARAFWTSMYSHTKLDPDDKFRQFHQLNYAMRYHNAILGDPQNQDHAIDQSWGKVDGLERPGNKEYMPWDSYIVTLKGSESEIRPSTVQHFYHYWQIYELYQVRRSHKGMYRDNVPVPPKDLEHGDLQALSPFFDAVSYFQHFYRLQRDQMLANSAPDDDGWTPLDQGALEQRIHPYAISTLQDYKLDEDTLYAGLRGMMYLHNTYEKSERVRLAEALKADIWRTVQFIHAVFGTPTEGVAECAGKIGDYVQNYLALLFPNRRKEVRNKAAQILQSLAKKYNAHTSCYSISDSEIEELLDYIESTDLALFEYILVELNKAHFDHHSWRTAEMFLHLKILASFPESLMRTLILKSGDAGTQNDLNDQKSSMSNLVNLLFRGMASSILRSCHRHDQYQKAASPSVFTDNLSQLMVLLVPTNLAEEDYIGVNLALATLVRNFTSHFMVEDPQLLQGQYVQCVRAILSATFSAWKVAERKGWNLSISP